MGTTLIFAALGSPVLLFLLGLLKDLLFKDRQLLELELSVLQLKITNKALPDYARLAAYDEYKRKGGNSWVDIYVRDEGLVVSKA